MAPGVVQPTVHADHIAARTRSGFPACRLMASGSCTGAMPRATETSSFRARQVRRQSTSRPTQMTMTISRRSHVTANVSPSDPAATAVESLSWAARERRSRRLTRRGFKPTWSPDGREIAFTSENADLDPQNTLGLSSLWVVDVASGEERQLGSVDAVLPSWSPNGHRIAYTTRGAIAGSTRLDIGTVDRSGANPVAVTTDGSLNWNPVWAPDGRHLYFVSGRGGPVNLWRVSIDESLWKNRWSPGSCDHTVSFLLLTSRFPPTVPRIAYSSILRSRNIQKLPIDPATGNPRGEPTWITTGSRLWANPDPSPDGKWVVFYSSVQPEGHLDVARTDGTGLRQLTSDAEPIEQNAAMVA